MRFITDSRMRRRKEAEKVGYSEAKQLYEKKLKSLRDKLEQEKENASRQLKDYANLISKILAEIEDNQMKIADLEIASSSNLAIVAITKDFHKLHLGGLAVTIYRLITDRKFIRQVKEEFIFGSYKDMIMNDYI